jgi:hypothetical protein
MKREINDILQQADRRDGMTVPDGFFADFAAKMEREIDARPAPEWEEPAPRTFWQKVRPYVYMAAMFAGIWCMLQMFNVVGGGSAPISPSNNPVLAAAVTDDNFLYDNNYIDVDDYDLYDQLYEQGFSPSDL